MFYIIGGDGKEYGPVTVDQVRTWITAGRANLDTRAKAEGTAEWKRLAEFPEFGGGGLPPVIGAPAMTAMGPVTPLPTTAPQVDEASVGGRIGAALLNAFIYFLSIIPGSFIVGMQMLKNNPELMRGGIHSAMEMDMSGVNQSLGLLGFYVMLLVQVILLATRGQNLGMMAAGVKVVRADNGQPAGFVHAALLRFLLLVFPFLIPGSTLFFWLGVLLLLVDFCFIFRDDKRCLHDLIAGTRVVKARH